jgi:hypothetical protein
VESPMVILLPRGRPNRRFSLRPRLHTRENDGSPGGAIVI